MEIMKKETIFLQLESMNNKGLSFLFTPSFDCRDAATVERTLSAMSVGWGVNLRTNLLPFRFSKL